MKRYKNISYFVFNCCEFSTINCEPTSYSSFETKTGEKDKKEAPDLHHLNLDLLIQKNIERSVRESMTRKTTKMSTEIRQKIVKENHT